MIHKITDLPVKKFTEDIIDNCFFVEKPNSTNMAAIPLKDIFDKIIERAKKEGLWIELKTDKIVFIHSAQAQPPAQLQKHPA